MDTLIPPDADAGAQEAGVVQYIDRQLLKPFRRFRDAYQETLQAIDDAAVGQHGKRFHELPSEARQQMLQELEKAPKRAGFEMILAHTLQGYFGDPRHGGNRDYSAWKMIGVPPMPVRGRQHYDVKDTYPGRAS